MKYPIDWQVEAPVIYHSAFESHGFSKAFRRRYKELRPDEDMPEAWAQDRVRIDNKDSMRAIEDIGIESCGKGLTVAVVSRRALPALRIMDAGGCEYPDISPERFVMHHARQLLQERSVITREQFEQLSSEARCLHLRIVSREDLSPQAATVNRYSALSV